MKVIELKCPNCGAPVQRGTMRCEYCGANLVLKNGTLTFKEIIACPKCGAIVAEGSFFCNNCEELVRASPEDLSFLRSTLKKTKLIQDEYREWIGQIDAEILEKLERDEFIYTFLPSEWVAPRQNKPKAFAFWVATNRRVIVRYHDGKFVDIPHENIAFVREPNITFVHGIRLYEVSISTFQGDVSFFHWDYEIAYSFYEMCATAHRDYESARDLKRKDTILLLWKSRDKIKW